MNKWFAAAALLSVLTTVIHIFGGGPAIHLPMLQTGMADDVRATWSVVWHGVSALLGIGSVVLIGAALAKPWGRAGAPAIGFIYFSFAGLFVFYGLMRLGNLTTMPQWTIFVLMSLLIALALRRENQIQEQ